MYAYIFCIYIYIMYVYIQPKQIYQGMQLVDILQSQAPQQTVTLLGISWTPMMEVDGVCPMWKWRKDI